MDYTKILKNVSVDDDATETDMPSTVNLDNNNMSAHIQLSVFEKYLREEIAVDLVDSFEECVESGSETGVLSIYRPLFRIWLRYAQSDLNEQRKQFDIKQKKFALEKKELTKRIKEEEKKEKRAKVQNGIKIRKRKRQNSYVASSTDSEYTYQTSDSEDIEGVSS